MKAKYSVADRVYSLDHDKLVRMQVQAVIDDPDVVAEVTYICEWPERDREHEEDNYFLESQLVPNSDEWVKARLLELLVNFDELADEMRAYADGIGHATISTTRANVSFNLFSYAKELQASANNLRKFIDYAY